jgi:hypothetical protein
MAIRSSQRSRTGRLAQRTTSADSLAAAATGSAADLQRVVESARKLNADRLHLLARAARALLETQ